MDAAPPEETPEVTDSRLSRAIAALRAARPQFDGRIEFALYAATALVWIALANLIPGMLPIFPIFILFAIAGVWLIPALVRRLRR